MVDLGGSEVFNDEKGLALNLNARSKENFGRYLDVAIAMDLVEICMMLD